MKQLDIEEVELLKSEEIIRAGKIEQIQSMLDALHSAVKDKYDWEIGVAELLLDNMSPEIINAGDQDGRTVLHIACSGYLISNKLVEILLAKMCKEAINASDENGHTALHFAAMGFQERVVETLLASMSTEAINAIDNDGNTAAHFAVRGYYERIVRILFNNMSPDVINASNKNGETLLHLAVTGGKKGIIGMVLAKMNPEAISAVDKDGKTALHLAAMHSNGWAGEMLRADPEVINAIDEDGNSLLHLAVTKGSEGVVEILLARMTPEAMNVINNDGRSALHLFVDCIDDVETGYDRPAPIWEDPKAILDILCTKMSSEVISAGDKDGKNVLHLAASRDSDRVIKELLPKMRPEDIDAVDNEGNTILHLALKNGSEDMIDTINTIFFETSLECISSVNDNGETALYLLIDAIRAFKDSRVIHPSGDINEVLQNEKMQNFYQRVEDMIFYMSSEALNAANVDNNTALHLAIMSYDERIVGMLLDKMSPEPFNIVSDDGKTILHLLMEIDDPSTGFTLRRNWEDPKKIVEIFLYNMNAGLIAMDDIYSITWNWATQHNYARVKGELQNKVEQLMNGVEQLVGEHLPMSLCNILCEYIIDPAEDPEEGMEEEIQESEWIKFRTAIQADEIAQVQSMLAESPALINVKDEDGNTALHFAFRTEYVNQGIVEILLAKMRLEVINASDKEGKTALHLAMTLLFAMTDDSAAGENSLIETLLAKMRPEAINAADKDGKTALHLFVDYIFVLLASITYYHEFGGCIARAIAALIPKMRSEAINAVDKDGKTALHRFADRVNDDENDDSWQYINDAVDLLLQKMSQEAIDAVDNEGNTVLHLAARRGIQGMINTIFFAISLECINSINNNGETALHLLVDTTNLYYVNYVNETKLRDLYERIEDMIFYMSPEAIAAANIDNHTALHLAVILYNEEVVEILLNKMSPEAINIVSNDGKTILHLLLTGADHDLPLRGWENAQDIVEVVLYYMNPGLIAMDDIYSITWNWATALNYDRVKEELQNKVEQLMKEIEQLTREYLPKSLSKILCEYIIDPDAFLCHTNSDELVHMHLSSDALDANIQRSPKLAEDLGYQEHYEY